MDCPTCHRDWPDAPKLTGSYVWICPGCQDWQLQVETADFVEDEDIRTDADNELLDHWEAGCRHNGWAFMEVGP
jgi:hypothetical protein